MSSYRRFALVAVVLAVAAGGVLLAGQRGGPGPEPSPSASPTSTAPVRGCLQAPASGIPTPAWFPDDLPMPAGSFALEEPASASGGSTQRVIFVVPGSLRDFVVHALGVWPKQGWALGRGEAEPGEVEDQFAKPSEGRFGAFRGRSIYCGEKQIWVLIVLGRRAVTASPSGTASP